MRCGMNLTGRRQIPKRLYDCVQLCNSNFAAEVHLALLLNMDVLSREERATTLEGCSWLQSCLRRRVYTILHNI